MMRPEHTPQGDPCEKCGRKASVHRKRMEHSPNGDPCDRCGKPANQHRGYRYRPDHEGGKEKNRWEKIVEAATAVRKYIPTRCNIVGIDGEGWDLPDKSHVYTYLCAVGIDLVDGKEVPIILAETPYEPNGLTHQQCVDMILSLSDRDLIFGFSFGYDITKIIEGMPKEERYLLLHPNQRKIKTCQKCKKQWRTIHTHCPRCGGPRKRGDFTVPIRWDNRNYDYFNGSFAVGELKEKKIRIWDCFRFFGRPFAEIIHPAKGWDVSSFKQAEHILSMKSKRGEFKNEDPIEIMKYCQEECFILAKLMRKLIEAHHKEEWVLKAFYGAGSTSSAMLEKYNVNAASGPSIDELDSHYPGIRRAIMSAFFGGRFENSFIGRWDGDLWNKDIASAYPYALTFMPCLRHGYWRLVKGKGLRKAIEEAPVACVKFRVLNVPEDQRKRIAWGPLPFRDAKGSICYPVNFTGWAWKPEILEALDGWPEIVVIDEAWVFTPDRCNCESTPFAFMPQVYTLRVQAGKEGRGETQKLGINGAYGKLAESVGGGGRYQNWIWAGMTTATCRAMNLRAIRNSRNPWNILSIATDGIITCEDVRTEKPIDTGTEGLTEPVKKRDESGEVIKIVHEPKEPLGGWESKKLSGGMFFAKPGIYYEPNPDPKNKKSILKARGLGHRELSEARQELLSKFKAWTKYVIKQRMTYPGKGPHGVVMARRFYGAKSTLRERSKCRKCNVTWVGSPGMACTKCSGKGRLVGCSVMTMRVCAQCGTNAEDHPCSTCGKPPHEHSKIHPCEFCNTQTHDVQPCTTWTEVTAYGRWARKPIFVEFDPHPKRERTMAKAPKGEGFRLFVRNVGGLESEPYRKGVMSPEVAKEQTDFDPGDQPDAFELL